MERIRSIFPSQSMKIDESSCTLDRSRRFIEPYMASTANAKNLQIDSTVTFYFLFVIFTEFSDFLPGDLSVGDIDILWWNIDMIKQILPHVVIIAFDVVLRDGIVLVQVESDDVLEGELALLIHLDQLFVDFEGSASCCKS